MTLNNGQTVDVVLWDTCGQERFHAITKSFFRNAHGAVVVYDVTNKESFQKVENWHLELNDDEDQQEVIAVLVGNKVICIQNCLEKK